MRSARDHLLLGMTALGVIAADLARAVAEHTTATDGGIIDLALLVAAVYHFVRGWRLLPHPLLRGHARAVLRRTWLTLGVDAVTLGGLASATTWGIAACMGGLLWLGVPVAIGVGIRIGSLVGDSVATIASGTPSVDELQSEARRRLGRELHPDEITAFYAGRQAQQHQAALDLGVLGAVSFLLHHHTDQH